MSTNQAKPSAERQPTKDSKLDDSQMKSSAAHRASNNSKAMVAKPGDIICGRGFHIANHRGNLDLHLIINKHRDEYLQSKRPNKTRIIKHILQEIKKTGARFIKSVSDESNVDTWEEVDYETAYKKVSHALRLKKKNETNRSNGSIMGETDSSQHRGDSNGGSGQLIPSRVTLPVVQHGPSPGQLQVSSGRFSHAAGVPPPQLGGPALSQIYRQVYLNTLYSLQHQPGKSPDAR
ncbi:unnamed protein product [Cylindrotheca closterium]|uniref:DUF6824 domain-containing protein n=1 Tax=Cylindrotheca closterium TaxID=2856 RepID=A0AAD2FUR3_9STRA|nr:unnamed protein product [Cylindrotheca closterium]